MIKGHYLKIRLNHIFFRVFHSLSVISTYKNYSYKEFSIHKTLLKFKTNAMKEKMSFLLLMTILLFSCSREQEEGLETNNVVHPDKCYFLDGTECEYELDLSGLGVENDIHSRSNYGINKLGAIKSLNPNFKPNFIVKKDPDFKIAVHKEVLKDLDGNILNVEKEYVQLYETHQFQVNNFKLNIGKFHIDSNAGIFGPNEKDHLKYAIRRFRKIYSHPHFKVYMKKNESENTPSPSVLYNRLRNNAKTISFARKRGIKGMKASGSKISISSQIKFPGGVKPLGKLSHEIGHVYGYGHGTNVNGALERFVKHFYPVNNPRIPDFDVHNLNSFDYETVVKVDAPLNDSWTLTKFRKNGRLKIYKENLPQHPSINFDLIDGNRNFSGNNGCTEINGVLDQVDYSSLLISTVETNQNCSQGISNRIVNLLKQARTYEIVDDGNKLVFRRANGKAVLIYNR